MKTCPLCVAAIALIAGTATLSTLVGAGKSPALPAAPITVENAKAFTVDGVHSFVTFKVKHLNVAYAYGRFNKVSGSFLIDPENLGESMVDVKVDAASVDTANEGRDRHLRGQDFFSVNEFPEITFKSSSIVKKGDAFEMTGDLSFHGVTKTITVPLEYFGTGQGRGGTTIAGFESIFTIKRSEYGITYMPNGLGEDVTIMVSLEGVQR
ncbi:MAG: YceI family protein [Phycisphaeraceae bacterium]|nr:YceI family protein [Phycisphaeraceae bacterium]